MFDSASGAYPGGVRYAAGYVDGAYRTYGAAYSRTGKCCTVGITVSNGRARDTDLEPGNPGADTAGKWAHDEIAYTSNKRPMIYTMDSWSAAVHQSLAAWGIPHCSSSTQAGCFLFWDARWDYSPGLYAGDDCRQWTQYALGGQDDESTCGTWVFSAGVDPRIGLSYDEGYDACYATARGAPYREGYGADHKAKPYSASAYDAGCSPGAAAGNKAAYNAGFVASSHTKSGNTYTLAYRFGFNFGYADGADRPFYTGFVAWHHRATSHRTAFNTAWPKGRTAGFQAEFKAGYAVRLTVG